MKSWYNLIEALSDGKFHSGGELGDALGLSRSAIWKGIHVLADVYGIHCHKIKGKGYAIPGGLQLLSEDKIKQYLSAPVCNIEILPTIDSTNCYMLQKIPDKIQTGHACFAEFQSAGKGSRGRAWTAPFASSLLMSVYWVFSQDVAALQGLTLSIAVRIAKALQDFGLRDVQVKWPNDIYWQGKKLAGILVEMQAVAHEKAHVVVGMGMNLNMPTSVADTLENQWADVKTILGVVFDRNALAACMLDALLSALAQFESLLFDTFVKEWAALDMLFEKPITVQQDNVSFKGIAKGIQSDTAILVDIDGKLKPFYSGDVRLSWKS